MVIVQNYERCLLVICCPLHLWARTRSHCSLPGERSNSYKIPLSVKQVSGHKELLTLPFRYRICNGRHPVIETGDCKASYLCVCVLRVLCSSAIYLGSSQSQGS